jgi:hypothetical protein
VLLAAIVINISGLEVKPTKWVVNKYSGRLRREERAIPVDHFLQDN